MKLHLAAAGVRNQFTGYGDGYVAVNHQRYERSIVVSPEVIQDTWSVSAIDELTAHHITFLIDLAPEILLLGTGARQRFPRAELLKDLMTARIGLEVMDTPAACRTYNILSAEGRDVIAAVLVA
ncbi:MAG TPA: Mth938-like domain-containing protein [Burkholderiales bacterium]|nr:Mth938-like domain-containing protein [Burkholderiales bacterium]